MISPITYFIEKEEQNWQFICYASMFSVFLPCTNPFFRNKWHVDGEDVVLVYLKDGGVDKHFIEACDSADTRRMYTLVPQNNFRLCARELMSWEKFEFAEMKKVVKITGEQWYTEQPKGIQC